MLDAMESDGASFHDHVNKWVDHYGRHSVNDLFDIMNGLQWKIDNGRSCDIDKVKLMAIKRILKQ